MVDKVSTPAILLHKYSEHKHIKFSVLDAPYITEDYVRVSCYSILLWTLHMLHCLVEMPEPQVTNSGLGETVSLQKWSSLATTQFVRYTRDRDLLFLSEISFQSAPSFIATSNNCKNTMVGR